MINWGKTHENASLCLAVSRASDLCDDLEGDDDFLREDDVEIPLVINRDRKVRKKKFMTRKMFGGVTVLESNLQNYNDES
jgi:hypothetical protein